MQQRHLTLEPVVAEREATTSRVRRRKGPITRRREAVAGYLFISPVALGILFFTLFPLGAALYYSFTDYNLLSSANWIGLSNYQHLWLDPLWYKSLWVTLIYALVTVPLSLIGSLGLALLLNRDVVGVRLWRALFYLPVIFPIVASSLIWKDMFNANGGLLNTMLVFFHIPPYAWVTEPETALPSLIIMGLWGMGGSLLIWISGLRSIPEQLYEAAKIDGANSWQSFWRVTLPMLSPVLFFNLIIGIINSLQVFAQAQIITTGGPLHATFFVVVYIYQAAFQNFQMGYASAISWMLFLIIALLTVLIFRSSGWVYYEGGEKNA